MTDEEFDELVDRYDKLKSKMDLIEYQIQREFKRRGFDFLVEELSNEESKNDC
jgi:hypothetical protein